MEFDIITLSESELNALSVIQLKLLRTAQKKKNDLLYALQKDIEMFRLVVLANNMQGSDLVESKRAALTAEYEREVEILREQLIFNMSLSEPTSGDETGGSGDDNSGYAVDYSLSYLERYIQVRDYYLTIADPDERLALYSADEVAKRYLNSYYNTLYNYLESLSK